MEAELRQTEKLEVVPVELLVEWDDIKEFRETGCILSIQPPSTSKKGKKPVNVRLDPPIRKGDLSLLNYICNALITKQSYMIPFIWNNRSVRKLARHYHIHRTSSLNTIRTASFFINSFSEFIGLNPDEIIASLFDAEGNLIPKAVKKLKKDVEEWVAELKALDYAPNSIKQAVSSVKVWLQLNDVEVGRIPGPRSYIKYPRKSLHDGADSTLNGCCGSAR